MMPDLPIEITEAVTADEMHEIASLYPRKREAEREEMIRLHLLPEYMAMTRGLRTILLARLEEDVVGTVQVVWENAAENPVLQAVGSAVIHHLRTRPGFEGRGIGSRLMGEVERRARRRGAVRVALGVEPDNARAMRLYRSRGYEAFHQYRGEHGEPIVGIRKSLVP